MKEKNKVIITIIGVILFKLLYLLTRHVQEDAFITWRVAKNIIDYGVYGFNGEERISSSTTHLYVLICVFFRLLFSDYFIYPLLIFNGILFTLGTKYLADLLLNNTTSKILFIIFVCLLPPALKISILGMEFGMLFFLYVLFLYYALVKRQKWAFIILPVLIIWTRLDAGLFLVITFLYDWIRQKKLNYPFILGGILGGLTIMSFNYFYFGEIVNNTIVAKKIAYESNKTFGDHISEMISNTNFYSMLKIPRELCSVNVFFIITLLLSIFSLFKIKNKLNKTQSFILFIIYTYSCIRIAIFGIVNSWFDWYYWIPQIFMFVPVILLFIENVSVPKVSAYILIFCIPLTLYQTVHSIATGNGEWNYNRNVGIYIDRIEPDKNKTIYMESAGYISYFSKLKVIDYVGLVDKRVTQEFIKDRKNVTENILKDLKPNYILEFNNPMFKGAVDSATRSHYQLIKEFHISDVAKSDNYILNKIYRLKPSGTDYYLYKRID
ncbi:MAG: hypothetical protein LBP34_09120 [Flavobacteriaceae bacterium]|jgi:hypothetical protein|nr:hypothetical protein [Flavobacteriaceae bacterium]